MIHEQKCPLSRMQVSHLQTWTQRDIDQKSHGRCNSNSVDWLCLYSLCTCLALAKAAVYAEYAPLYSQMHWSSIKHNINNGENRNIHTSCTHTK